MHDVAALKRLKLFDGNCKTLEEFSDLRLVSIRLFLHGSSDQGLSQVEIPEHFMRAEHYCLFPNGGTQGHSKQYGCSAAMTHARTFGDTGQQLEGIEQMHLHDLLLGDKIVFEETNG